MSLLEGRSAGSRPRRGLILAVLLGCGALGSVQGAAPPSQGEPKQRYQRSTVEVDVPDVTLVDQGGKHVRLRALLAAGHPVALNFFFASCRSICPVMTATFASMRTRLGKAQDLTVVSVTIDPEQDTPDVLRTYAESFSAGAGWTFLTGDPDAVQAVQSAFGADAGGKFNHRPLFYLRSPGASSWVKLEGLAGAADLASEVRLLSAPRSAVR